MSCCVIIPSYNGEQFIGATLESVFNQTLAPAEVIIVDDVSTDNTLDVISKYKDVRLFKNDKNSGPGVSRRFALEQSGSPLVIFLDQDDIWHPEHLQRLHEAIVAFPGTPAAVAKQSNFLNGEHPVFNVESSDSEWFDAWDFFPLINPVSTPSAVLINRSILDKAGGWAAHYTGTADYHLWLRLCAHHPLRLINSVTIGRRAHENSLLNRTVFDSTHQHMQLRFEACSNVVDYLQDNYSGKDKNKIETAISRINYYQDIHAFIEAVYNNRLEELPGLVEKISAFIETCPDIQNVNVFLFLYYKFPHHRKTFIYHLIKLWPQKLSSTKNELQYMLPPLTISSADKYISRKKQG